MNGVKEQSGILTWTRDNIKDAPETCGVLVLRFSPVNGDILLIEASENINIALRTHLEKEEPDSKIKFFEWYSTNKREEAEALANFLLEKHSLH
ncbi:hypothetical protein C4568_01280 [Candidatus Parcubacteria bacterium]|nr:MAG: hypothetical protein C4568_01280 [Candidatus Parcubacteria bacterium]